MLDDLIQQILAGRQGTQAVLMDRLRNLDGQLMEIRALLTQLTQSAGDRGVQVQHGVSGSIIITGNGNHISLFDGGRLAQWWNEIGPEPEVLLPQYLAETARAYESLLFLPGHISKPIPLDEVYVELPIIKPVTDEAFLQRRHPGTRQSGDDLIQTDEIIRRDECAALIGFLGAGKTTTLRYLAWVYARRSEDYPYWRGQEIIPFYVKARDLARTWTESRRSEGVAGFTSALAEATAVAMPTTMGRQSIGRILELSLNQGRAMVLLDALDEFRASEQERSDFMIALQTLWKVMSFEESSRSNRILLTSRPYRFLNPLGFAQYGLLDIEHDVSWLVSRLGGAILSQRSDLSPAQVDAWLEGLSCAICQPRLREFRIPFYVTLMTYLATGKVAASEGLALLDSIGRLTDLYNVFVYQTIAWERSRSNLSLPEDTELKYVLGKVAQHTLLEPLNADNVKLVIADEMRCSLSEAGQLLSFWLGTGFLSMDETQNAFLFCHSGFQAYGMAFMLAHWWHHGQRQRVEDISRRYLLVPEWDTVWKLFEGLR